MRLSFAAVIAALFLLLPAVGTAPVQAKTIPTIIKGSEHKHYKLYVRKKGGKAYHHVHTFKTAKEAHKIAHKFAKRGYRTKIRTV
jgi:hypothetical protein